MLTTGSSPSRAPRAWCGGRDARCQGRHAGCRRRVRRGARGPAARRGHDHQPRELDALHAPAPRGRRRRPRAAARLRAAADDVPRRRAAPRSGHRAARDRTGGHRRDRARRRRGVLPASRGRPGLDRPDAAHPGAGRACDDVQGPLRRHPPAQPRDPTARPGGGRPAPREPLPHLRLRRRRLRGRRSTGRDAAARRGRRPPLPRPPGRAAAVGPGRRRTHHPGRGASPARGPHVRTAAPQRCRDPDVRRPSRRSRPGR